MLSTTERADNYRRQSLIKLPSGVTARQALAWRNGEIGRDLTPRQRRRVIKKLLRATKRRGVFPFIEIETFGDFGPAAVPDRVVLDVPFTDAELRTADYFGDQPATIAEMVAYGEVSKELDPAPLADWEEELLNQCPTCQAMGDEPCKTKSGNAAKKPHANRPA